MAQLRNKRHEKFALAIFTGMAQGEAAIEVGYSPSRAYATASRLVRNGKISARIDELFLKAESDAVMTVQERMARLSEVGRARFTDFITLGPDGAWVNIGPECQNSAALQEVNTKTEYDENGDHPVVFTRIRLHDPVRAINEMNKMDGSHAPTKITGGEGEPLLAPIINLHMPDGTIIKPPRNGEGKEEAEALLAHSDNGE